MTVRLGIRLPFSIQLCGRTGLSSLLRSAIRLNTRDPRFPASAPSERFTLRKDSTSMAFAWLGRCFPFGKRKLSVARGGYGYVRVNRTTYQESAAELFL